MKRTHPPLRAVVFDLDGTLVDSMPLVLRAFTHAMEPFRASITEAELISTLGGPPDRTFLQLIGDVQHVPTAMRRLRDFSLANWKLIQPFDGMHDLLDTLRAVPHAVAIWTGRERESTEWILREQSLLAKLDAWVCGDDLPTHKPHPGGLEEVLRRLSVERDEAIFVGDADVDVLAGAEGGVRTILIRHGRAVSREVEAKAWHVVETPAQAYAFLREQVRE